MTDVLLDGGRLCVLALFTSLAGQSFRRWRRENQGEAARWLTASFTVLAVVVAASVVFPHNLQRSQGTWEWKLTLSVLVLFPYCLYRFTAAFRAASPRLHALCGGLTASMILWTLLMPDRGGAAERSGSAKVYVIFVLAQWTVLSMLAAGWLWRAGRGEPSMARNRMRMLSLGSVMVNLVIVTLGAASPARPWSVQLTAQVLGMAGGWLFFAGFAPPAALRALWRQRELESFHLAQAQLIVASDPEAVAAVIVPQAVALLGGHSALMTGADGAVLGAHRLGAGGAEAEAAWLGQSLSRDGARVRQPKSGLLALGVGGGWLAVQAGGATPFFGREEIALLEALGDSAELALQRIELFERDRSNRDALQERGAQLKARADQQAAVAHLGQRALGGLDVATLFQEAVGVVTEVLRADRCEVLELTATNDALLPRASTPAPLGDEARSGAAVVIPGQNAPFGLLAVGAAAAGAFGATDVDFLTSVANVLAAAIERHRVDDELVYQALHDPLTGLPNRALLMDRLAQVSARSGRQPTRLAVFFLDIDRFKVVNDGLGHWAGDQLLQAVATRLATVVRPGDTVARFGGDEFVVLCEDFPGVAQVAPLAERIAVALAEPVTLSGREVTITASIGVVLADAGCDTPEALIRDADTAMYQAKERGRARFEVFDDPARQRVMDRLDNEVALRRALERDELSVFYQPVVSLADGRIIAAEALLRWDDPVRGLQLPGDFLPLAEETGLILPIGAWMLEEACRQAQVLRSAHPDLSDMTIWVNLSARQLVQGDLPAVIAQVLAETGTDPALLGLEVTESVLTEDVNFLGEKLAALKSLGVLLAIDDFGTGFSSLCHLRGFPVDVLKVDPSFVAGITGDQEDYAIVDAVVGLAGSLGMVVVAEGVESAEQVHALRRLGCDAGQGFFWCAPLAFEAILATLPGLCANAGLPELTAGRGAR